jgi:predicted lipoprotein with Yx(FWY)xxD motif
MHDLPLPRRATARVIALLLPAAAVTALVAGCGGGDSHGTGAVNGARASAASAVTVRTEHTGLGTILADGRGRTLYLFEKDKGPMSTCDGACASIWPPLTTSGPAHAGAGVAAAKLGSSARADGSRNVTYAGHPLYTYAGDGRPGATDGEGLDQFGAEWYVVGPNGRRVEHDG